MVTRFSSADKTNVSHDVNNKTFCWSVRTFLFILVDAVRIHINIKWRLLIRPEQHLTLSIQPSGHVIAALCSALHLG